LLDLFVDEEGEAEVQVVVVDLVEDDEDFGISRVVFVDICMLLRCFTF
jgi:hypothetical protein